MRIPIVVLFMSFLFAFAASTAHAQQEVSVPSYTPPPIMFPTMIEDGAQLPLDVPGMRTACISEAESVFGDLPEKDRIFSACMRRETAGIVAVLPRTTHGCQVLLVPKAIRRATSSEPGAIYGTIIRVCVAP